MKYAIDMKPETFFIHDSKLWQVNYNGDGWAQEVRADSVVEVIDLLEVDEFEIRAGKFDVPGDTSIYVNRKGQLHRAWGKPAIDSPTWKQYSRNGLPHRIDGPAMEYPDGEKQWWVYGLPHRIDGPAMMYPDGTEKWWVNGQQVDKLTVMLLQHPTV